MFWQYQNAFASHQLLPESCFDLRAQLLCGRTSKDALQRSFCATGSCSESTIIHSHLSSRVHPALGNLLFCCLSHPGCMKGSEQGAGRQRQCSRDTCGGVIPLHVGGWVGSSAVASQRWVSLAAVRSLRGGQRQGSAVLVIRASRGTHRIWVGNQPATHFEGKARTKLLLWLHWSATIQLRNNQPSCRISCASEIPSRFQDTSFWNNWQKTSDPPPPSQPTNSENKIWMQPENVTMFLLKNKLKENYQ